MLKINNCHLILTKLLLLILFSYSYEAFAGCGESSRSAWSIDTISGSRNNLGMGTYKECGNISGAFGGWSLANFYVGWAKCNANCDDGFKVNVTYVKLYDAWKQGVVSNQKNSTCVQQNGDTWKYCWNN